MNTTRQSLNSSTGTSKSERKVLPWKRAAALYRRRLRLSEQSLEISREALVLTHKRNATLADRVERLTDQLVEALAPTETEDER